MKMGMHNTSDGHAVLVLSHFEVCCLNDIYGVGKPEGERILRTLAPGAPLREFVENIRTFFEVMTRTETIPEIREKTPCPTDFVGI